MTTTYPIPGVWSHRSFQCAQCGESHLHRQLLADRHAPWEAGAYLVLESGDVRWTPAHPPTEPNLAVATVLELEAARAEVATGGNGHAVDATADTLPPCDKPTPRPSSGTIVSWSKCALVDGHAGVCRAEAPVAEPVTPTTQSVWCGQDLDAQHDLRNALTAAQAELAALRAAYNDLLAERDALQCGLTIATRDAASLREQLAAEHAELLQVRGMYQQAHAERYDARCELDRLREQLNRYKAAHQSMGAAGLERQRQLECERQAREALQAKVDALCKAVDAHARVSGGMPVASSCDSYVRMLAARAALKNGDDNA